jgi:hypothetical protein
VASRRMMPAISYHDVDHKLPRPRLHVVRFKLIIPSVFVTLAPRRSRASPVRAKVYAMVVEWLAQPGRSLKELKLTWEGTGAESKDGWGEHVYLDSTPSLGQQLVGMRPFHSVRGFMAWRKGEGAGLSPATVELNVCS